MKYTLFLVGNQALGELAYAGLFQRLAHSGFNFLDSDDKHINWHSQSRVSIEFESTLLVNQLKESLRSELDSLPLDGFVLEDTSCLEPQLIIMDMDSTLVQAETIDQIAKYAGRMSEVASITESAMRGELDFVESLTKRVAMLNGIKTEQLEKVHSLLPLTSGAQRLIAGAKANHCRTVLVSGGFTYFAKPLAEKIGIDEVHANHLELQDNQLTGQVIGDIVDAEYKRNTLNQLINQHDYDQQKTIAIGDGANDLLMLSAAGLGIAFHGKPKVQQQAEAVINHYGLEALCWLLDW